MNKDIRQLETFEKRLGRSPKNRFHLLPQDIGLFLVRCLYAIIEILLSILFILVFTLPSLFILSIRKLFTGKDVFVQKMIYGADARPLKLQLFNVNAWLPRHSSLFIHVLSRKLSLVGVSFRDYETVNIMEGDPWLLRFKPGIINLHFIQSSSRIAAGTQNQTDWDYLHHRKGLSDLMLLLLSIPALLYHHTEENHDREIDIFGIKMLNIMMSEAIELIDQRLTDKHKTPVFFVNPDCLNKVFIDKDYYRILQMNEVVFPDGIGINLAGKMLGTPLRQNLNGTDMLPHICELAQSKGYKIYLLGAGPSVAETMKAKLQQKYAKLEISGTRHGFFNWEKEADQVISEINQAGTDILLVAFGAPNQEKFITRYGNSINANIQMGVGGLFDFYSDRITRAPLWMRQIGLEWVFRLMKEPKRMWKRYIIGNPLFLFRVFRWKMNRTV